MSAALQTLSVAEFLDWERQQPVRYEFDGIQPLAMTGGTVASNRVTRRLVIELDSRIAAGCEVFFENIKLITEGRIRYPDVMVSCGPLDPLADDAKPVVVFEILSPSTELTDRRVKPFDYASVPSVQVYVILPQDRAAATILRRSAGWVEEEIEGMETVLSLPEINVSFPLGLLHRSRA